MPPVRGSHSEYFVRRAPLDIFRRKEAREVMTDNLFASVTFDSFGASIPTNNNSVRVQHEDRVVLHFVEEYPILFFAIPQCVLCRAGCLGIRLRDMTEFTFYVE